MSITAGHIYKHRRKQTLYLILAVTNLEATDKVKFPPAVTYVGEDGNCWSRPLEDFEASFQRESGVIFSTYTRFQGLAAAVGLTLWSHYLER